jgi:hypothetical protein
MHLFLPSEVTKGIGNNHSRYEVVVTIHYYHVIPSNIHHPPHMLSHTSLIITSSKERGKICIYQCIKNTIKIQIS